MNWSTMKHKVASAAEGRRFALSCVALLAVAVAVPQRGSDEVSSKPPVTVLASSVATPTLSKLAPPVTASTTTAPNGAPELPASVTPTTTVPPWTVGNAGTFAVEPGGALPSDAECAARVTKVKETRAANSAANRTTGSAGAATYGNWGSNPVARQYLSRVSGKYKGTTDEIIQWASCKWGFDPETVRAQVMVESGWRQGALGGFVPDVGSCSDVSLRRIAPRPVTTTTVPGSIPAEGVTTTSISPVVPQVTQSVAQIETTETTDTTALSPISPPALTYECPTAFGLFQIRGDYQPGTYPMSARSTAFNADYSLAMKRACYDGVSWLGSKTIGNAWGCVGVHFSGRWLDPSAQGYVAKVQEAMETKAWTRL